MADGTTLAKAYVQIMPSARGMKANLTKEMGGDVSSAGSGLGSMLGGKIVSALGGVLAAAGIGKMISNAISEGADLEQSIGGIETLFGTGGAKSVNEYAAQVGKSVKEISGEYADLARAQEQMLKYADEAYKTAGLSANDYMETVTSFAASLKQSVGDDTEALTTASNQAVIDMADNANRLGTPMESIMNAYQGFAKQNYNMLDNLKLGYGGTKEEMKRLLEDAEKLSGVKYDIGNLADVYSAINVIQTELGYTGTTAKEASTTISGSLAMVKASWSNVLAKMTIGDDVTDEMSNLIDSVVILTKDNLLPALKNIAKAIAPAIKTLLDRAYPVLKQKATELLKKLPQMLKDGTSTLRNTVSGLLDDIISGLNSGDGSGALEVYDYIFNLLQIAVENMVTNFTTFAPKLAEIASLLVNGLCDSVITYAPQLAEDASELINQLVNGIIDSVTSIDEGGLAMVTELGSSIVSASASLVESAGTLITNFVDNLLAGDNLEQLISKGTDTVLAFIDGIIASYPDLVNSAVDLIVNLAADLMIAIPRLITAGEEACNKFMQGLGEDLPSIAEACTKVWANLKKQMAKQDWGKIGIEIAKAILSKIDLSAQIGAIAGKAVSGAVGSIKQKIAEAAGGGGGGGGRGYGEEGENESGSGGRGNNNVSGLKPNGLNALDLSMPRYEPSTNGNAELERRLNTLTEAVSNLTGTLSNGRDVRVVLEGDAKALVQRVRKESITYRNATGRSVFA